MRRDTEDESPAYRAESHVSTATVNETGGTRQARLSYLTAVERKVFRLLAEAG